MHAILIIRRRLPVVMVRLGMANNIVQADTFIKHVNDAWLVFIARDMFVWVWT